MGKIYTFTVSGTCDNFGGGHGDFRLPVDALNAGIANVQVVTDLTNAGYTNVKITKTELTRFVREVIPPAKTLD